MVEGWRGTAGRWPGTAGRAERRSGREVARNGRTVAGGDERPGKIEINMSMRKIFSNLSIFSSEPGNLGESGKLGNHREISEPPGSNPGPTWALRAI